MKEEKTQIRNPSPIDFSFSIVTDCNEYIFSNSIFLPLMQSTNIHNYLNEIGEYQNIFLRFMKSFSLFLLKRARIHKREDGWYMKYLYGCRK